MPFWAADALRRASVGSFSKGLVAYEALMLTNGEYSDSLNEVEAEVRSQLPSDAHTHLDGIRRKRKNGGVLGGEAYLVGQLDETDDPEASVDHVDIYLPNNLIKQLTVQRGLGYHIAEALAAAIELPWRSRLERVHTTQQLVRVYYEQSVSDPHPVVEAVLNEDESSYTHIPELREALGLDATPEPEYWERDDLMLEDIRKHGHTIPQKPRTKRTTALQTAIDNAGRVVPVDEIEEVAMTGFGIKESSLRNYLSELDVEGGVTNVSFVASTIRKVATEERESMSRKQREKMKSKPDYWLVGFKKEIMKVDGTYATEEDAVESVESALSRTRSGVGSKVIDARKRASSQIRSKLDELTA